jgi:hypothetical protein
MTAVAEDEEDAGSLIFPPSPTIAYHPYNTLHRPYRGGHRRQYAIDGHGPEEIQSFIVCTRKQFEIDPGWARMQHNYLRMFADDADSSKLPQPTYSYSHGVDPVRSRMQHGPSQAPYYLGGGLHGSTVDLESLHRQSSGCSLNMK